MSEKLTVLIPTYNRKDRLLNTLLSLQNQTDDSFEVVLLDNASDYDMNNVFSALDPSFVKRVSYYRNFSNIGLGGNISNIFLYCKTGWAWILSDDDKPNQDAVEIIRNSIDDNSEAAVLHFPIIELLSQKYRAFHSLNEMIDFYNPQMRTCNRSIRNGLRGDFIFLSNKVYNIPKISNYYSFMFSCSGSFISHALIIVKILDEKAGEVVFVNKKIVNFYPNDGSHWDIETTTRGISSIGLLAFKTISQKQRKKILKFLMFDYTYVLSRYIENGIRNPVYLKDVYRVTFKIFSTPKEKFIYRMFILMSQWGFSFAFLKLLYSKIRKRGNKL